YQVPDSSQVPDLTLQNSEETIRDLAQRILRDKLSIKDIRVKAHALANSAPNANAGSSRLSRLRRELKSLGATLEIIEVTKFPDITKEANEIQQNQRKFVEAFEKIDYPDHFTLESVKERLDKYDISTLPDIQALADIILMLCIRPAKLTSLRITDAGPGVKWFNRFLKDYSLIPKYLRKMGAVYGVVTHEAKNMAHAYTIAGELIWDTALSVLVIVNIKLFYKHKFKKTLVEGKILVKALIDTTSRFNTISKRLFDRLGTNHGIGPTCDLVKSLYEDAIGEIHCLDLQFQYKEAYHSLDGTDAIDFEIRKNPPFDLVLGQGWLWVHEVKMSFKLSPKGSFNPYAKIVMQGMSIPLIDEDFNKTSSTKNNSSNSMDSKPNLTLDELADMFKKLSLRSKDNISDSIDSSLSRLRLEVINMHKTASAKKHSIRKRITTMWSNLKQKISDKLSACITKIIEDLDTKNHLPEIENTFTKITAEINTKITNELTARLFEINSSFTVELGKINTKLNDKLTVEIKKINSRDVGYASEAHKLFNDMTTRINNIEEACYNNFASVNASIEALQNGLIQHYAIIRRNQPIEADQQIVSNHSEASNRSHTSSSGNTNRPGSPNNSYPSSANFVIKMWIHFEGELNPVKLKADVSQVADLDDFKDILRDEFEELKNIKNQKIVFLDGNKTPLRPGIELKSLADKSTDIKPLLVRYPFSNANSKCKIPHTSGSLSLLREEVIKRFKELQTEEFYFFSDETKDEIRNEYSFNILVSQTELDSNNYNLKLKVKVEGKKSYSDWELKEVFKEILRKDYKSLSDMPKFSFNEFPSLEPPFTGDELKNFVRELQNHLNSIKREFGDNEMMARFIIDTFMSTAVCHIQDHINNSAQLCMEKELEGSRGYGPVDYVVRIVEILVLLCEAKSEDMKQGMSQVLVQMYSAVEQLLGKRKHAQTDFVPMMFGIVTTGKLWRFVRWTGSLEEPTVHISEEYTCNFIGNMEIEKEVLTYISQILQAQAKAYDVYDKNSGYSSKRQRTNQENDK
ncbi:10621_t:CDS:2, partial [Gigaspora margarita]